MSIFIYLFIYYGNNRVPSSPSVIFIFNYIHTFFFFYEVFFLLWWSVSRLRLLKYPNHIHPHYLTHLLGAASSAALAKHSDTTFLNVWPLTYLFLHYQTSPSYSSCSQLRSTDTLVLCVHKYSAGMQYYLDTCHLNETWSEKWAEKYNGRHSRLILMYIYPDRPEVRIFLLQMYPEVSSTW